MNYLSSSHQEMLLGKKVHQIISQQATDESRLLMYDYPWKSFPRIHSQEQGVSYLLPGPHPLRARRQLYPRGIGAVEREACQSSKMQLFLNVSRSVALQTSARSQDAQHVLVLAEVELESQGYDGSVTLLTWIRVENQSSLVQNKTALMPKDLQ